MRSRPSRSWRLQAAHGISWSGCRCRSAGRGYRLLSSLLSGSPCVALVSRGTDRPPCTPPWRSPCRRYAFVPDNTGSCGHASLICCVYAPSPACIRAISTVVCRQAHPCFMACPLTYCWYTSPLRPLGRNRNSLRHRRKQVSLQPARPRRSHGATASGRQIVVVSVKIGASIFSLAAS